MVWGVHFQGGSWQRCAAVEHVVRVNEAAHLLVYVEEADELPREAFVRGSTFELADGGEALSLVVVGWVNSSLGRAIRAIAYDGRETDPPMTPPSLLIHQRRRSEEGFMIFIDRLSTPRQFEEIGERENIDDISVSIPVGACVLSFAGETPAATSGRAVAAIIAGSNTAMGQARALRDERWRLLSFNRLDDDAPGRVHALGQDVAWMLDDSEPSAGVADCSVGASRYIEDQWAAFEKLHTSADATAELAEAFVAPTLPMSVSWSGESFFAAEISVLFRHPGRTIVAGEGGEQTNVEIRMKLVREPRPARGWVAAAAEPRSLILLGRVQGKPDPDDAVRLLEVVPAAPEDAEGIELTALTGWRSGDDLPLQVVQPAPGYAREDTSAFYARWTAGDLILVQVTPGAIPIGLGAPRRHVAEFEQDGAPEVALRGKGILQRAEGATRSSMLLQPNGEAAIIAPNRLALAEAVSITPDLVSIERKTRVIGELDVD